MEKPKTYLELLAENDSEARKEFEPNAKELFIDHREYEDDVDPHGKEHDELEDQEAFQRYQGSHQQASYLGKLHDAKATHTNSVPYDKSIQIHVLNIDSRFRSSLKDNPSNFTFKLLSPIKNVISIRLSSLEIPNTWYTFSEIRGNTSLTISIQDSGLSARAVIPEGNYSLDSAASNSIQRILVSSLKEVFPAYDFTIVQDPISGLISISCFKSGIPTNFSLDFTSGIFTFRNYNWGLGYNLGFRSENFTRDETNQIVKKTGFSTIHTASEIADVKDLNYLFLSLNPDWRVVEHNQPDKPNTSAFAKIIVNSPKNGTIYDNGSNTITKKYNLKQPTNVSSLKVTLLDEYEEFIQLMGGAFSLTLEITEVLDSALYETHRT
jgi:hypothetical protein